MTIAPLGSGAIISAGAGAKAANLDQAVKAGIDVPAGMVVLDDIDGGGRGELAEIDVRVLGPLVAVRSAFSAEDSATSAMAGRFDTELNVPANAAAVWAAVERVRSSGDALAAESPDTPLRRDVLVMKMVRAERAGVVFTEQQFEDDLVNVVDGLADSLVSGEEAGRELVLAKLRRFERPSRTLEPWVKRLAVLLRDVRSEFGELEWDIEWADDGERCWLVQIRPITAAPRRDETFTIANHKEILPELPSVLMTSIVEASAFDLMSYYRAIDPTLPVDRPFIESFAGRPYINLSQLTDLLRRLGLPTRLLAESLGGEPEMLVGLNPIRLIRSIRSLTKLGVAQFGAVGSAREAEVSISEIAARRHDSFATANESLREVYVELVTQMSSLATAMTTPVALLRAAGTLEHHLSSQRTPGTQMLDDLAPLSALLRDGTAAADARRSDLGAGQLPSDPVFVAAWEKWVNEHGHRGVFESDIARPRFAEDPGPILASILVSSDNLRKSSEATPAAGLRAKVSWPLWAAARRPMAARERIRWSTMQAFAALRSNLLELADAAVLDGRLPTRDAVWNLSLTELAEIDEGRAFSEAEWQTRQAEVADRAELRLPDLVRRFDDLDELTGAPVVDSGRIVRGVSLTSGVVEGVALRASEPPRSLPEGFAPEHTVLVARSVDAGWVPIFGQVAGVAVEIGGDLSHGSIILRELGLPAVTNLGDLGSLATGDPVRLDAGSGRLERLSFNDGEPNA